MKIAELFAEIGFNIDEAPLGEFVKTMGAAATKASVVVAAVTAAAFAVKKLTDASIQAATAMRNFRVETGLSAEELQRWQVAAQLTNIGASAESVTSSIQALQSNLAQIRLGQGNIRPFQLLGISAFGDAFAVLDQLRERIKGLDEATTVNLLNEMGLGSEFIHVLRLSREEFEKLADKYALSNEQIDALTKMGNAFKDLGMYIGHVTAELSAFLSPSLTYLAGALKDAVRLIIAPFELLWRVIKMAGDYLEAWDRAMGHTIPTIKLLANVIVGLVLAFNPLIAAITAILLLIEDFLVGMSGGKSLIFGFFELFKKKIGEFAESIKSSVKGAFMSLGEGIRAALEPVANWIYENIIKPIDDLLGKIPKLPSAGEMFDGAVDAVGGAINTVGTNLSNTFNNIFNITSDNPQGTASAVTNSLQEQLNFGLGDLNNAGAY